MQAQKISVEVRESRGKGPARQLRMSGMIPAVFYGPGVETMALALSPKDLSRVMNTEYGKNMVLNLSVGGQDYMAMMRDVQVHPVSRTPLHVDLYRVTNEKEVNVRIPLTTTGRAIGVQKGGRLNVVFRDLPVRATPENIPASINVKVDALDIGDVCTVGDLELSEGVTVKYPADRRVVLVTEDKRKAEAAEEEAAAAAEGAPAEGAAS